MKRRVDDGFNFGVAMFEITMKRSIRPCSKQSGPQKKVSSKRSCYGNFQNVVVVETIGEEDNTHSTWSKKRSTSNKIIYETTF